MIKKIIKNGDINKIDTVCITHLHMDHIGGFELFVFYKQFKNETFNVFGGPDFLEYYKQMKCSVLPVSGEYYQPFDFKELFNKPAIHGTYEINKDINMNAIKSIHMGGSIPAYTFTFIEGDNPFDSAKVIISGDTDNPINTTAGLLEAQNIICFHDMGWTGNEDMTHIHKAHATEKEVFDMIGNSDRVFGIHINDNVILEHYQKAIEDKEYTINNR